MQRNPRKIIIGGGITGLIWNFYHPEFYIITPESSGETFTRTYMVWLHDEVETRKLLTDLGFDNVEKMRKRSPIGYFNRHWIADYQTREMNLKMIQKKMTPWDKEVNTSFIPKTTDMSLSVIGGDNYLNTLDVDLVEIIKRLNEKATIVNGFVTKITDKDITVKQNFKDVNSEIFEYDELISTIAAPFFWKGFGQEKEFLCLPITNIVTSVKPKEFNDRYEMVYYDDSVPFSRISHLGGKYALEFTGEITKDAFEKLYPELKVDDYFVVKQGRIFENDSNEPPNERITFTGRFGRWQYGITAEHVVAQALNYKNN